MADLADIFLNVGGWIVAGLVTLAGVKAAHRYEERARQGREDLRDVFRPLLEEVGQIVENRDNAKNGMTIWIGPTEAYRRIMSSGALVPDRFVPLRESLRQLEWLSQRQNAAATRLWAAVTDGLGDVWVSLQEKGSEWLRHRKVQRNSIVNDSDLNDAIRSQNESMFERRMNALLVEFEGDVVYPTIPAAPLYGLAYAKVQEPRAEYDRVTEEFLAGALNVRGALEDDIRRMAKP